MNKDTGGRVIYYIDGDISGFEKAVDKVKYSLDSVSENAEKSSKRVAGSFENISPSFLSISSNLVRNFDSAFDSIVSIAARASSQIMGTMSNLSQVDFPNLLDSKYLKKSAISGVKINAQIEDAALGMSKLLGSKAEADRIQAKILKGAADTPFGVGNLTEYVQQLAAVTKNGDKAYDTVMAFGKAIKISGGSLGDMSRMIVNLQQASSSGMTIIDYRQFKRAIPIFDDILKAAGLTTDSILRKAGDTEETIKHKADLLVGALEKYGSSIPWSTFDNNFSQIKDSFEENVSTTFANAMKNSGAFEMLKKGMINMREALVAAEPEITEVFKIIANAFKDVDWGGVIKALTSSMKNLFQTVQKVIPVLTECLKFLGGGDVGKGIANLIEMASFAKIGKRVASDFNAFGMAFNSLIGGLKAGTDILSIFGNGIGVVGNKLSKVGNIFSIFSKKTSPEIVKSSKTVVDSLRSSGTDISNVINTSSDIISKTSSSKLASVFGSIKGGFVSVASSLKDVVVGLAKAHLNLFKGLGLILRDGFLSIWNSKIISIAKSGIVNFSKAVGSGIKSAFSELGEIILNAGKFLSETFSKIVSIIGPKISYLGKIIGKNLSAFGSFVKENVVAFGKVTAQIFKSIGSTIATNASIIGKQISSSLKAAGTIIKAEFGLLKDKLGLGAGVFKEKIKEAFLSIASKISELGSKIYSSLSVFGSKVKEIVISVSTKIVDVFKVLGNKIGSVISTIGNFIGPKLEFLANFIAKGLSKVGDLAYRAFSTVAKSFKTLFVRLGEVLSQYIGDVIKTLSAPFIKLGNFLKKQFEKLSGLISKGTNKLSDKVGNKIGATTEKIFNKGNKTAEAGGKISEISKAGQGVGDLTGIKKMALASAALVGLSASLFILSKTNIDFPKLLVSLAQIGVAAIAMVGLTKLAAKANLDIKGITSLALIAGIITGFSVALMVADKLIPNDFLGLQVKIASMYVPIVVIGGLAALAGKLISVILPGLGALALIFVSLIAGAKAVDFANKTLPSSDSFVEMQKRIRGMALVIGEVGLMASGLGLLMATGIGALVLGSGLAAIVSISASLAATAIGIKTAIENMPSNLDSEKEKITKGIQFVKDLKKDFGGGIGGIIGGIGKLIFGDGTSEFDVYVEMSRKLASMANNIKDAISNMPSNFGDAEKEKITKAVEWLKGIKASISGEGGVLGAVKNWWSNNEGTQGLDTIIKISESIKTLADNLVTLKDVSVVRLSAVVDGPLFSMLKSAIDKLKSQFTEKGGVLATVQNFWENNNSTVGLENASKISELLSSLVDNLSKIENVNIRKLENSINVVIPKLKDTVSKLLSEFVDTAPGGLSATIKGFVNGNKQSIENLEIAKQVAEKLGSLVDNLGKIGDLDLNKLNSAISENGAISKLKQVVVVLKKTFVDDADSVKNTLTNFDISYIQKASEISEAIAKIGQTVSGVGNIQLNVDKINTFINNMKSVIDNIATNFGSDNSVTKFNEEIVNGIKNIESVAASISSMSKNVNEIQEINLKQAEKNLEAVKNIISEIVKIFVPGQDNSKFVDITPIVNYEVESNINTTLNVLTAMSNMAKTANEMQSLDTEKINQKLDGIKSIIEKIKDVFFNAKDGKMPVKEMLAEVGTIDLNPVANVIGILKSIADTVAGFPNAVQGSKNLTAFTDSLAVAITNLTSKLASVEFSEKMKLSGSSIVDSILNGFVDKTNSEAPIKATLFTDTFISKLNEQYSKFIDVGKNVGDKIFEGFVNQTQNRAGEIAGIISEKITWPFHNTYQKTYNNAGDAITAGLAWGINSSVWRINQAMGNISNTAVDKLKSLLGIHSPSKVFYSLGQYIGEGLADGLESMTKSVTEKTKELVNTANIGLNSVRGGNVDFSRNSSYGTTNKTNNVYMTNNISNNMDLSAVMGQLKWNIDRA